MNDKLALSRRALLAASAASFATVSLSGSASAAPTKGGKLIYARYADSLELDPVFTDANVDIWVMNSIYDTLLLPTKDGKDVRAGLATKWELSDGGKTLTLTLREGVKFSDGTALTADDVVFSLDRARAPKNGPWADMIGSMDAVSSPSANTVVIKLKHPDPTLLPALAMFNTGILPKAKYMATEGKTEEERAKTFAAHPIGTGPFMLDSWQRGVVMKLKRNPHYWGKDAAGVQLPYLDEIEFPIIPDDATRLLKLKAGEIHGTEFVPYSRVKELQADPNLRMELWPSTKVTYITLNCRPEYQGKPNPLGNPKVRQAINYAVNKQAVIAITTLGLGKPMGSYMSSVTPLQYPQNLYPYDVAKAKALLAEAGFSKGLELTVLTLSGNQDYITICTTVQQMLAAIGVKLNIEQMDNPTLVARYRKGDFQARTSAWTDDIADPSEITSYFAYSPNIDALHSGWKSAKVDALFLQSQQEVDVAKRREQYKELQTLYAQDAPILFLYETPYPVCFRKNVTGFVQIPLGNNYFDGCSVGA